MREEYSLDDLGSDDLAGTAPGGEEVDDHEALLAESGVEVGLAVNHVLSVFCLFRAQGWRANAGARVCVESTYVVRLWTPVEVDMVEEKLRVVLLVMLVMLLLKVREKVAGLFSLNASGVVATRRGDWDELLKNARERVRDADILEVCGWSWIYMADME